MQIKSCAPQTGLSAAVFLSEAADLLYPDDMCPSSVCRCLGGRGSSVPGSSRGHEHPLRFSQVTGVVINNKTGGAILFQNSYVLKMLSNIHM